jgi:hypothetical protein
MKNGCIIAGEWKNDILVGSSSIVLPDGERYDGGYADGEFNGYGKYSYKNGDFYEGMFEKGLFHGSGKFSFANGKLQYFIVLNSGSLNQHRGCL